MDSEAFVKIITHKFTFSKKKKRAGVGELKLQFPSCATLEF